MTTLIFIDNSINNVSKEVWILDSCCNNYMTQNKDRFFKLIKFTKSKVLLKHENIVDFEGQ